MLRDAYYVMGRIFGRLAKLNPNINMTLYTDHARQDLMAAFARLYILMTKAQLIDKDTDIYIKHYLDLIDVDTVPHTPMQQDDYDRFYFEFMKERNNQNDSDIIQRSKKTQEELAQITGVTRQTIARWQTNGKIPMVAYLAIDDAINAE